MPILVVMVQGTDLRNVIYLVLVIVATLSHWCWYKALSTVWSQAVGYLTIKKTNERTTFTHSFSLLVQINEEKLNVSLHL